LGRGALRRAPVRFWAFGTAAATLAVCLLVQPLLLGRAPAVLIPGLADFEPAWNRGVSFSLFAQDSETGRALLMVALVALSIGVAVFAWRASSRLNAAAFGLVLGGALGNLIDRARFDGAVFDFLFLHLGRLPLFVCNLPDIAISAGVVLLFADAALEAKRPKADSV
jgi:signal peptidase II